ncbi:putative RNA methyltransferase [Pseudonocardia parietis]|uniref:putative RNA methyltransferase n=1 Tax=Pseudonocardia parietis TaxID=570936 RepID=UPI0035561F0F
METSPAVGCHADGSSRYPTSLDAVLERLRCPQCHAAVLRRDGRTVHCQRGHSFDIARQGYLTLLSGRRRHRGDTAEMVTARDVNGQFVVPAGGRVKVPGPGLFSWC